MKGRFFALVLYLATIAAGFIVYAPAVNAADPVFVQGGPYILVNLTPNISNDPKLVKVVLSYTAGEADKIFESNSDVATGKSYPWRVKIAKNDAGCTDNYIVKVIRLSDNTALGSSDTLNCAVAGAANYSYPITISAPLSSNQAYVTGGTASFPSTIDPSQTCYFNSVSTGNNFLTGLDSTNNTQKLPVSFNASGVLSPISNIPVGNYQLTAHFTPDTNANTSAKCPPPFPVISQKVTLKAGNNDLGKLTVSAAGTVSTTTGAGSTSAATTSSCDVGALTWVVCPIIDLVNTATKYVLENIVEPLLVTSPYDANNPLKPLWQGLLYLSDIFFAIIFMVVIFGASFGLQNYSIKKILPRLIASAILIQFSYYIAGFIIDIGNITGTGMLALIGNLPGSPGVTPHANFTAIGAVASTLLAAGAFAVLGFGVVGFAALSVLVGVLTILVTLVFRQIIIAVLVVTSPLAFAAWVLPNTESYFKIWMKNLIKISLMYPLIAIIVGVAGILANAGITATDISAANGPGATKTYVATIVTKGVLSLAPLFALIAAGGVLKGAGTIMGGVSGKIASRGNRLAGSARKRAGAPAKQMFGNAMKNRSARIQEKNLMNSRKGGLKGMVGAARAGYVNPKNKTTQRALASAQDKALSDQAQGAALEELNKGIKVDDATLLQQRTNAARDKVLDTRVGEQLLALKTNPNGISKDSGRLASIVADNNKSEAERIAAMQQLSTFAGGRNELAKLRTSATFGGTNSTVATKNLAMWDKGIAGVKSEQSPDLLKPVENAFKDVTAKELASFDVQTTQRYIEHVQQSGDVALQTQLSGAVNGVASTNALRTSIQGKSIQALRDSGVLLPETAHVIDENYNSEGQFISGGGINSNRPAEAQGPLRADGQFFTPPVVSTAHPDGQVGPLREGGTFFAPTPSTSTANSVVPPAAPATPPAPTPIPASAPFNPPVVQPPAPVAPSAVVTPGTVSPGFIQPDTSPAPGANRYAGSIRIPGSTPVAPATPQPPASTPQAPETPEAPVTPQASTKPSTPPVDPITPPATGTPNPAGVIIPDPNARNRFAGTIRIPGSRPTGGGFSPGGTAARQSPRISERLVDPRVEGEAPDELR